MRKYLFPLFLTLIPVSVDVWLHYNPALQPLPVSALLYAKCDHTTVLHVCSTMGQST